MAKQIFVNLPVKDLNRSVDSSPGWVTLSILSSRMRTQPA